MCPPLLCRFTAAAVCWLSFAWGASAQECPSGFGEEPTPSERELAAMPVPDSWFREMTADWHGPRLLAPLRERWHGFAAADPASGFAVLAALLAEAEGDPGRALAEMSPLTGDFSRWNEARLLALLGRRPEAEAALAALVSRTVRPDIAAAALLALTDLDCIRGDFAAALARSAAAWESRQDNDFRLRILERHVSLLAEFQADAAFLEALVSQAAAASGGSDQIRARSLLAGLAVWFTADSRLGAVGREMWDGTIPLVRSWTTVGDTAPDYQGVPFWLAPSPAQLDAMARAPETPSELGSWLADWLGTSQSLPADLSGFPPLRRAFELRPLPIARRLFSTMSLTDLPPPLLRSLAQSLDPGAERRTLELIDQAWAGKSGPETLDALAEIIVESPSTRCRRGEGFHRWTNARFHARPSVSGFPAEEVLWNFNGESWLAYYRARCRSASYRAGEKSSSSEVGTNRPAWSEWRPELPGRGSGAGLSSWAWRQLRALGGDTPERVGSILGRLIKPAEKLEFALLCGRMDVVREFSGDSSKLRVLPSGLLMRMVEAVSEAASVRHASPDWSSAGKNLLLVIADRSGMTPGEAGANWHSLRAFAPEASEPAARGSGPTVVLPHPLLGKPYVPSASLMREVGQVLSPIANGLSPSPFYLEHLGSALLGTELFQRGPLPPELLRDLKEFPTTNPLKQKLLRHRELAGVLERGVNSANAEIGRGIYLLRELAAPEGGPPAPLVWQMVVGALKPDPADLKRALEVFAERGPLAAGTFLQRGFAYGGAASEVEKPIETLLAVLRRVLADPALRSALEPVGAIAGEMQNPEFERNTVLRHALRRIDRPRFGPEAKTETERLLEIPDPLAARLAVTLAGYGDEEKSLTLKALAMFPEDPELLLAYSAVRSWKSDATAVAAFVRALRLLTALPDRREHEWCGKSLTAHQIGSDRQVTNAIVAFADRVKPATLPPAWMEVLRMRLRLPQAPRSDRRDFSPEDDASAALVLARYTNSRSFSLDAARALRREGKADAAAETAEIFLTKPGGSLASPDGSHWGIADPWQAGPVVTGWECLLLAKGKDPAGLADRLRAAAATHPGDEQLALAAMLAHGLVRPILAEDTTALLAGLTAEGRHRVLFCAARFLPDPVLPPSLCVEAWEAQARAQFLRSRDTNGFLHVGFGLEQLERIPVPVGGAALGRVLPALLDALETVGRCPAESFTKAIALVRLAGTDADRARLGSILERRLQNPPEGVDRPDLMIRVVESYPDTALMPESLVSEVDEKLKAAAPRGEGEGESESMRLAAAAAPFPRWRDAVRAMLQARLRYPSPFSSEWNEVRAFFRVTDAGLEVPEVRLDFTSSGRGEGELRWAFQGLALPGIQENRHPPTHAGRAVIAGGLAGKFDALILAETLGVGSSVVGRLERLPASGATLLKSLPPVGRLSFFLTGTGPANAAAGSRSVGYNTSLPLADSEETRVITEPDPPDWRLLTTPFSAGTTTRWHIEGLDSTPAWEMRLVMLDTHGRVCAASEPLRRDSYGGGGEFSGFSGALVDRRALSPWTPPVTGSGEFGGWRVSSPPWRYALASPERGANSGYGGNTVELGLRLPRLTVKEWPDNETAPAGGSGRLEILHLWSGPGDRPRPYALAADPPRAAWVAGGRVHVLRFDAAPGAPPEPQTLDLELPREWDNCVVTWHGSRLSLFHSIGSGLPGGDSRTEWVILDPEQPKPIPPTNGISPEVWVRDQADHGAAGVLLLQNVNDKTLRAVVTPDGRFLSWPESAGAPPAPKLCRPMGAASLAFQKKDHEWGLLDWTDGTLKVTPLDKSEAPEAASPKETAAPGTLLTSEEALDLFGPLPLPVRNLMALGGDRFLGIGQDVGKPVFILLRSIAKSP